MTTWLLDGNVLVALCLDGHAHHGLVMSWFESHEDPFATCPVTQGTLLRLHMQLAEDGSATAAWTTLRELANHPRHRLWTAEHCYLEVPHRHLQGPKQITDAWLAELARRHRGRLASLDGALVALHSDIAELIAT